MAKEFSIKGVLEFLGVDKSVNEIKKFDSAIGGLRKNTATIGKGASQFGAGMKTVGLASAAVGAGFGLAIKEAADFEQAMANINSVNELTAQQFRTLELAALNLGSTTNFSATEAAGGMFELTKAGLSVEQTLQAIPGVLAAAATEGLDLAKASELMVGVLQGQNLKMGEATRVADVLAKVANSTSAGITDLGEAFKYANQLSSAGLLGFEDTAAALGMLSNAGLKGSIAGTSLVAMFNQITKPSKHVQTAFGGMNNMMAIFTDKATGKMKDLPELIEIIGKAADAQSNDFMKMAFLTDFVGVEGAKAFSSLRRAVTQKDDKGRLLFQGLREDLENATGTAMLMAMKRLDTTSGLFKLMGNVISTVGISIGKLFLPKLKEAALEIVGFIRNVSQTLIALNKTKDELTSSDITLINSPLGQFLQGFVDGIKDALETFKSAFSTMREVLSFFGITTGDTAKELGHMIGKFLLMFAAMAPLIGALYLIGTAFGAVFNILNGSRLIIQGAYFAFRNILALMELWWPIIVNLGRAMLTFMLGPIGLTILGVTALVVAGYFLYKNWDAIWGTMKQLFTDGVDWIINSFTYLGNWFKSASIGEIIIKTLLAPIRLALTPLMEMIQFLMNTNLGKSIFGTSLAGTIQSMASSISLMPTLEPTVAPSSGQNSLPFHAQQVNQQGLENQRVTGPISSMQPSEVNVTQAPINLQNEIIVKLDGKEMSRQMSKQSVENSERAGQSSTNPKNRSMSINGQFSNGFGR